MICLSTFPILYRYSLRFLRCLHPFSHLIIEGIKNPIMRPYNGIQYSDGSGGGSSLKFAVKLPNLVILSFASGSSVLLISKRSAIDSKGVADLEMFIV